MRCAVLDIRTVSAAELARWETAAEPERRARWQQFRRPDDRARSICADHLARTLLREAGAQTPVIRVGRNGKPYVPDGPAFNCSHSGNFVCCAVHGGPVGIDLEARRPVRAALAARICTPEELAFAAPGGRFTAAGLDIDYDKRRVTVAGREIELTRTEYNILALLSQYAGKVITYDTIIRSIWGGAEAGSLKRLQVNMANIRKKLAPASGPARYISTEMGVGYRLIEPDK